MSEPGTSSPAPEHAPGLTFKDALAFVIDYAKFVGTLWSSYILLVSAMVGWLITMRAKEGATPFDLSARWTLIVAYLFVTAICAGVISHNNRNLSNLMAIVQAFAKADPAQGDLRRAYDRAFKESRNDALLKSSVWALLPVAAAISLLIFFLTSPK